MKCYMSNTWLTFHRDGKASITCEKLCLTFVYMPLWQVFDLYNSPAIKSDVCWNFMWHVPSCVLLIKILASSELMVCKTDFKTIWSCCCLLYILLYIEYLWYLPFFKVSGIDEKTIITDGTCQLHFLNFNFAQEPFGPPFFQYVAFTGGLTTIEPGRFAVLSVTVCHGNKFWKCHNSNTSTLLKK